MKAIIVFLLFGLAFSLSAQTQVSTSNSTAAAAFPYTVTQRGPHSRTWQQVTNQVNRLGQTSYHTNSYTELATGLQVWNGTAWAQASDQIQLTPNGAAATNTQHQVSFAGNLNTSGAISLLTPDNQQMTSQILGLVYFDSSTSNTALFAETQDSVGQLLPSGNQVIYTNAFSNAVCDVLYSQKLSGLEQDIVIRQQLPSPSSFGLTGSNIWLQVWTEFTTAPAPQISPQTNGDFFLDFGVMKMGRGKAFMLGSTSNSVPVFKEWVNTQGRTFLVESISLNAIAAQLSTLPTASGSSNSASGSGEQAKINQRNPIMASLAPRDSIPGRHAQPLPRQGLGAVPRAPASNINLPLPKLAAKSPTPMRLADALPQKGFVLDYNLMNGSQTNLVFRGDSTYYITNTVILYGTYTLEGGAVIKFSTNASASITMNCYTNLVCSTANFRPAIFTAQDDDTVGVQISGSTGTPTGYYGGSGLQSSSGSICATVWNHLRFSYLREAIQLSDSDSLAISDAQFINCQQGLNLDTVAISLCNALFYNVATDFYCVPNPVNLDLENVTIHKSTLFCDIAGYENYGYTGDMGNWPDFSANLVNCLLVDVTNTGPPLGVYGYTETNATAVLINDTGVFQTVGAGAHYLATNTYRGRGTTNLDAGLLADLRQKTTWPPVVLSNQLISINTTLNPVTSRDTNSNLDLGYHYDALDYILDDYTVTNATLTLTNGVAIACFNDTTAIALQDNSAIVSIGTPLAPIGFTQYQTVQEQSVSIGAGSANATYYIYPYHYGSTGPNGTFQFSRFSGGCGNMLYNYSDPWSFSNLLVADCEFWGGASTFSGSTNSGTTDIDNCLFVRSIPRIVVSPSASLAFSNNLVWCAQFNFKNTNNGICSAFNNIFDTCTLLTRGSSTISNGYNAYLNTTGPLSSSEGYDIVTNISLAYLSGPLGSFYQPANSPLLNQGSTNANLVGLYEFTTQTNEVKEGTNIVTMGYHYVAVDTNGNPDSTLWLGIPDYLVDTNSDGATNLVNWEMEYFGHTGLNPFSDPFNEGITLLQDYQSTNDMTLVAFTMAISNNYVSTSTSPVALAVTQGIPYYMAVLVDSTNFTGATWTNFSSNVVVNIGTNQGWHDVWVGLSALPTNAVSAWQWNRLKLDVTPPELIVTNPALSTVSVPLVQVQGYSPEELNTMSYDLANSTGLWTNIPAGIADQFYSTNTCEFTTNYFQCADVPLAVGTNIITLHATDMAGNPATTNLTVVLDYSTRTHPPAVTLYWPQNGTRIGNTNYTWRGWVDDPTATVIAQTVDTSGRTNMFNGIVERDGNFWVENLPINGTNYLTLTVTDSAGNVSTTNITVSPSVLALTVDAPDTNTLWNPPITVTGTISDTADYTLWVNGVQAVFTGGGAWMAANVPLPSGGTALIQARAIPNSDNGGNGTGAGGGGTNTSYTNPGNPTPSAQPNDAELQTDKPPRLYVKLYDLMREDFIEYEYYSYTDTNNNFLETDTYQIHGHTDYHWADGVGGGGSQSDSDTWSVETPSLRTNGINPDWQSQQIWTSSLWSNLVYGTQTVTGSAYDPTLFGTNIGPPAIIWEHCRIQWPFDEQWSHVYDPSGPTLNSGFRQGNLPRSADIQIMLQTGGKGNSTQKSLFQINASATSYTPSPAFANTPVNLFLSFLIPATDIQILGQNLGSDGNLYIALPDNTELDVTPKIYGPSYFTFQENVTKY